MRDGRLGRLLAFALLAAALGGVAVVMAQGTLTGREALLRYTIAALIVLAVAPAHALLPDPSVPWLQRLNMAPAGLLRRAIARWAGVALATLAPAAGMAFWLSAPLAGAEALLLLAGTALYAFQDTMALGPVSQQWQEGRRGAAYRRMVERNPNASFQVPHGMIPAMLASLRVFLVGFAGVAATVIVLGVAGPPAGWIPGALLAAWSAWRTARLAGAFDRAYYHTSGLYTELLHSPAMRLGARPALPYEALYWIPHRWRPHAWGGLLQLDRRLPMGRLVTLGVIGYWALLALGAAPAGVAAYLLTVLVARNAAIFRHSMADIAPPQFQLARQSATQWAITRFWMNTRWTLPLALAVGAAAFVSTRVGWGEVLFWTSTDLILALLTATGATYAAEIRYRRRFA